MPTKEESQVPDLTTGTSGATLEFTETAQEAANMDGIGQIFIEVFNLGVKHTFTELAESKRHERELKAIDHQLDRQERIALARAGSASTATLPTPVQPVIVARPVTSKALPEPVSACRIETEIETLEMPTTAETIAELKQRLIDELYRLEIDLQKGMRIAEKPCDCGQKKHGGAIRAMAEELMSYEANPLYGQITAWINQHLPEFTPKEIAKHEPGYYQALAPDIRNFRKQLEI